MSFVAYMRRVRQGVAHHAPTRRPFLGCNRVAFGGLGHRRGSLPGVGPGVLRFAAVSTLEDLKSLRDREAALLEELRERFRRELADHERRIAALDEAIATFDTNEGLHKRLRSSTVNEPKMEKSHRLAISEGHKSDDAFARAIRAKGFSQNSLAKRVGLNQAVLSLHRKELRRIKRSKAVAIEKLTGWPADGKHWPGGISDEE